MDRKIIREMAQSDIEQVLEMMQLFYNSPAVSSNGSDEIFKEDIANCIGDCPYLEGYIFADGTDIFGYAMAAKSFSTEFGKPCILIEDLYVKPEYRGMGLGTRFLAYLDHKYPGYIMRLEVEMENQNAMHVYQKYGYELSPYVDMKKIPLGNHHTT